MYGQASSMGSFLLAAGEGKRYSLWLKNYGSSTISGIPKPSYWYTNSCERNSFFEERLNKIYSKHTDKPNDEISKALREIIYDCRRGKKIWFSGLCCGKRK